MKFVAVKSEGQQAVLTLHRMRELSVKMRADKPAAGVLYEFGADLPAGRQRGMARIAEDVANLKQRRPARVLETARRQLQRIEGLDQAIAEIEKKRSAWKKEDQASKKLMQIPGGSADGPRGGGHDR